MPAAPSSEGSPGRRELPATAGSADTARPNVFLTRARPSGPEKPSSRPVGPRAFAIRPPNSRPARTLRRSGAGEAAGPPPAREGGRGEGGKWRGAPGPELRPPRRGPRKARGALRRLGPDPGPRRDPVRAARRGGRRRAHLGLFVGHDERPSLLNCCFTKEVPGPHRTSTQAAPGAAEEGGGSGGGGRGRAHVVRSLPPPCVREHEPPGLLIGCRFAGARNAYITTPTPPPRATPARARRLPGRREEARTRAPGPPRGRAWLWAGLYCPSVVELNQNGFQLVLSGDRET